MKWECLKDRTEIIFILLILIILYLICKVHKANIDCSVEDKIDTIYNTKVLDSIRYNIILKDSIITRIKYKYETEIVKVDTMSDNSSVELFKELCTSDSHYGGNNTN